jgi:pimeloyl-ACP methyl ester carboxylesterase
MPSPPFLGRALVAALLLSSAGCAGPGRSGSANSSGESSHFAHLGTNRIHYVTIGKSGPTILFVHGWACNQTFWREQIPAFRDKARLILIDLPGHGQSDKPAVNYSMDFFADAVVAVLRDARVNRAVLVGHSMGTPVICRVYAHAPERVAGLIAVDGILRRPKFQRDQVESFIGPYRTPAYREQTTNFVRAMFPNPGTEALRDRVLAEVLETPQYVMSSAMDNMFDLNAPAWDPGHLPVPVAAINAKSPMWTPEYEAYVKSLSDQTFYAAIEGTGHFLMLERPAEFNAALLSCLKQFGFFTN